MELFSLTNPVAQPSLITWEVWTINLDWKPSPRVYVRVVNNLGQSLERTYTGTDAATKITTLNKANLSTKSLHKRVLEILAADPDSGIAAGSITGSPD